MSSLKIGLLCDDSLDKTDGVQQYVFVLGKWLSDQGHDVHYISSTTVRTDIGTVHSISKNMPVRFNSNSGGMPLPANKHRVVAMLDREQFDVIHIQMPYSPLLAGRVIRRANARTAIIGTFHVFPHSWVMATGTHLLGLYVRRQLKRFDAIISNSTAAQTFAKTSFGVSTQIIPNMIDVTRFTPTRPAGKAADPLKVVFLGRLVARKGVMQLLQAIRYINEHDVKVAPYEVYIGGKGMLLNEAQSFAKRHGLSMVNFTGFVAEEDKVAFLAEADVAVFPSTGGESFGISVIEAMAAARGVVLAGDNAGYRTVMQGAEQQLVRPHDTAGFADTLAAYINDEQKRTAAHIWQTNHVKQYDIQTVGPQIMALYEKALRKRLAWVIMDREQA